MFLVMPFGESIEWIMSHMDNTNMVLCNEIISEISTYHFHVMHSYYKIIRSNEYANTQLYATWKTINTKEIIKSWC